MGWLGESEYNCPECDGECMEYGTHYECPECEGTGWDPKQVDIKAFKAAEKALNEKMSAAGCVAGTYEWIDHEAGERLGRSGGKYGHVAVADYLRE